VAGVDEAVEQGLGDVHNDRLSDAVHQWALGALRGSPGARAYNDAMGARKIGHHAALR